MISVSENSLGECHGDVKGKAGQAVQQGIFDFWKLEKIVEGIKKQFNDVASLI